MARLRLLLLGTVFCFLTPKAQAQNSTVPHQHASIASTLIDGAVHPELIPDSLAYRLYFVAVSTGQNPTEAERKHQQAHLMKAGLEESDREVFVSILSDFRSKYDALVAQYNDSARAALARNEVTDVRSLLRKLDELVQSTRDTMSVRLTTRGAARVHSFLLSEKKNMQVQQED